MKLRHIRIWRGVFCNQQNTRSKNFKPALCQNLACLCFISMGNLTRCASIDDIFGEPIFRPCPQVWMQTKHLDDDRNYIRCQITRHLTGKQNLTWKTQIKNACGVTGLKKIPTQKKTKQICTNILLCTWNNDMEWFAFK